VRTPSRPQPLDPLGLLLAVTGAIALVVTREPGWTSLLALGAAATALAVPGRDGAPWAWAGLGASGLGWAAGVATGALLDEPWRASDWLAWATQGLVLGAAAVVTLAVRRRAVQAADDLRHARGHARDATVQDALTGLVNRKGLAMLAEPVLESARRRGDAVYCVFVDVDGLGRVNAERGQRGGDEVLLAVADALTRSTRGTDAVARWGDDEFVVVGPGTGLPPLEIERRVRSRCREAAGVDPAAWQPRISAAGAVLEPWDDGDLDSLLRQAGREMNVRRALRREAIVPTYRPRRSRPRRDPRSSADS
jgi:diguanylate cyclase (GGDEF)-like protein